MITLRRTHRILALVASVFALELARVPVAYGHALAPSLLEIREIEGGRAEVVWKQPLAQPMGTNLRPAFPAGCSPISAPERFREGMAFIERGYIDCGGSLIGRVIGVHGIEQTQLDVLLRLVLADGRSVRNILNAARPTFVVPEKEGALQVATSYGRLGVEHILTGFDHLLFVLGLVLLVGGGASLLWTVTAFTVGHSITLALAVLGFVNIPQEPIEAVIALTIYILAVELVRTNKDTLFHRRPWLMAGVFGMLHGLGFAGALAEVGLPAGEIPLALFSFNVGIETGQIAFVAVVLLAGAAVSRVRLPWPHRLSFVPAYGIGCLAAFWVFERTAAVLR